ncbi:MAG TPA: hypothetical protein VHW72_18365 [Candidatus Angelobacter sp.]|jgi:hypothetical protein|nr:hypothetical protein [Candidatus Angelobacter sp.]
MDRRNFLRGLGLVMGGIALDQAIPLGRVWSFPKEIKVLNSVDDLNLTLHGVTLQRRPGFRFPTHLYDSAFSIIRTVDAHYADGELQKFKMLSEKRTLAKLRRVGVE